MIAAFTASVAAAILTTAAPHHHHRPAHFRTWLAIAWCESRDEWHINTGNGYYGGLQFDATSWTSEDVRHYAVTADRATRRQQMLVANRLLRVQGWGAWPVCSIVAGVR